MIRFTCSEVMHLLGITLERIEEMDFRELWQWRKSAVELWKLTHGVQEDA